MAKKTSNHVMARKPRRIVSEVIHPDSNSSPFTKPNAFKKRSKGAKGSSKCNWPRRQMGLGHQDLNLILKPLCCGVSIGEGRQGREIWGWGLGKEEGFRKVTGKKEEEGLGL
ncbi:hypothetical protein D5086_032549 [Populus alba]|uniref:Uncharacterized protein n=1 Tax=Populus alba TaxID=43335 RepID=A0ACC4ALM5_POPAL